MSDDDRAGFSFQLKLPDENFGVVFVFPGLLDLVRSELEAYRHTTKCIHNVRVTLTIDYLNQDFIFDYNCSECQKAMATKGVLDA